MDLLSSAGDAGSHKGRYDRAELDMVRHSVHWLICLDLSASLNLSETSETLLRDSATLLPTIDTREPCDLLIANN